MALREVYVLKIFLPVDEDCMLEMDCTYDKLERKCPSLEKIVDFISASDPVGRVGNYDNVIEIGFGFEGFAPEKGAFPTFGKIGEDTFLESVSVQTYATKDVSFNMIEDFIEEIVKIHPWEHPILELTTKRMWFP